MKLSLLFQKFQSKKILLVSVIVVLFFYSNTPVSGVFTNSVSQYGITWTFDQPYQVGQFANGDYWVVGPVKITSITPSFDGTKHGWEVNPFYDPNQPDGGDQGFDARFEPTSNFDSSLIPALPYTASPDESIVKAIGKSSGSCLYSCIQTAAVLTVVAEPPPDNGATVFRPPYIGTDKPYYSTNNLQLGILPSYSAVPEDGDTLAWIENRFRRVQFCHKDQNLGRIIRPIDNFLTADPYGSTIGRDNGAAALRLMLNDPIENKMQGLIYYVQLGIDSYHAVLNGQIWRGGGGWRPGMKIPIVFAAVMLDNQEMKNVISNADFFSEYSVIQESKNGNAVFGGLTDEDTYWNYIISAPSSTRQYADPYNYIDGGVPRDTYQGCCLSQPWKISILAAHLMPEMKAIWNNPLIFDYVDRWVNLGVWTQPDPCAPTIGIYRVNFGPDGSGGCILDTNSGDGIGRFPEKHATDADWGAYRSDLADNMWNEYRQVSCYDGDCGTGETPQNCPYDCLSTEGNTYYVNFEGGNDDNSGTSSDEAWQHAPGDDYAPPEIRFFDLQQGDTVLLKGGVIYGGGISINSNGASGNHITYRGDNWPGLVGVKAIINGPNIKVQGYNYITIEGFRIISGGTTIDVDTSGANMIVRNNDVSSSGAVSGAIDIRGNDAVALIENNYIHDVSGARGIYVSSLGCKVIIRNNTLRNVVGSGMRIDAGGGDVIVVNNEFYDCAPAGHVNVITIYNNGRAPPPELYVQNVLVAGNVVFGGKRCYTIHYTDNITVYNNIFYAEKEGAAPIQVYSHARNMVVLNNVLFSVYDPPKYITIMHGTIDNLIMKNNIISAPVYIPGVDISHNIYTKLGTTPGTGHDEIYEPELSKIFEDVSSNNPAEWDYHLKPGSPAIDAGTDITAILTELQEQYGEYYDFFADIEGNPRPSGAVGGLYSKKVQTKVDTQAMEIYSFTAFWILIGAAASTGLILVTLTARWVERKYKKNLL